MGINVASWPIIKFPPEIQEQCDRQVRRSLVSNGEAAFAVGMPIESCPDFVDSDMGVYWQIGWQTAWQRLEDEKAKRAMDLFFGWASRQLESKRRIDNG